MPAGDRIYLWIEFLGLEHMTILGQQVTVDRCVDRCAHKLAYRSPESELKVGLPRFGLAIDQSGQVFFVRNCSIKVFENQAKDQHTVACSSARVLALDRSNPSTLGHEL
ncbi:hypothetical protein O181_072077 [Austropuccinia psidii MF-1]|uniref:Uncharacterized protein n=1 Tax=Austropuccinia psidii MF-1 TaxID=1389203 RepID=A0A9Q3I9S9_9BASI|nr:hypothetical protein [Austropuccinia psidii MF-1]